MRIQSCRHVETVSSGELHWAGAGYLECYRKERKALAEGASKLVTDGLRRLLLPSLVISLFCASEVSKSASNASKDGGMKHRTRVLENVTDLLKERMKLPFVAQSWILIDWWRKSFY